MLAKLFFHALQAKDGGRAHFSVSSHSDPERSAPS